MEILLCFCLVKICRRVSIMSAFPTCRWGKSRMGFVWKKSYPFRAGMRRRLRRCCGKVGSLTVIHRTVRILFQMFHRKKGQMLKGFSQKPACFSTRLFHRIVEKLYLSTQFSTGCGQISRNPQSFPKKAVKKLWIDPAFHTLPVYTPLISLIISSISERYTGSCDIFFSTVSQDDMTVV